MQSSSDQVVLIFVIGTAGMLFMAATIVLFVSFYQKKMLQEQMRRQGLEVEYQKRMLQAALESQENERNRVSKDLHDDIGMMLMTVRTQVSSFIGKPFTDASASAIWNLVDEAHETVRRLSWDLKPGTLEQFGLTLTIRELCARLNVANKVHVDLTEKGESVSLEKNQETLLFRIIQESVTNALQHAQASNINILFKWNIGLLTVSIADDGTGFDFPKEKDPLRAHHGLGLISLENRSTLLGGNLSFEKNFPSGTNIKLTIPLHDHG